MNRENVSGGRGVETAADINRMNLKLIHRELSATDPTKVPQP